MLYHFRVIHCFRNTTHQNLCVALFIAEIIFLFGIDKTENRVTVILYLCDINHGFHKSMVCLLKEIFPCSGQEVEYLNAFFMHILCTLCYIFKNVY